MAEEVEKVESSKNVEAKEVSEGTQKSGRKDFKKGGFKKRRFTKERETSEFDKRVICARRVTKVVKGGKKMHFSVTMVIGDKKGRVGVGNGKAADMAMANDKAFANAKKHLNTISIVNDTIPHEIIGKYGKSSVLLMPAKEGTGIDAGGPVRAIAELAGIKNIVSKTHGSRNKINVVNATLNGLLSLKTKEQVAALRGKSVEEI